MAFVTDDDKLSFVGVQLEHVVVHPSLNSVDLVLHVVSCGMHEAHFKQQVQLVVICIRTVESVLLVYGTGVHDEKKRPKCGALWYSTGEQCCL